MPVVDYSKILIYKIQHKEKDELLYVGSTTHFGNRKRQHKSRCYNANGKPYNYKIYSTIRDNGGWDAFNMVIVKEFPCENKRQAEAEEDRIMRDFQASLNSIRAYQTPEERLERRKITERIFRQNNPEKYKEYLKGYYQQNKEKILERSKESQQRNKEPRKEYQKKYRQLNIDKLKEQKKQRYEKNKEILKEKTQCDCGCILTKGYLKKHYKTKKHQEYINQQTEQ